jgi:zinc protease
VDYFQRRNAFFQAVKLADLKQVAAEYMKPEQFTFVIVGEPELD